MHLKITTVDNGDRVPPGRIAVVIAETGEEVRWVRSVRFVADVSTDFFPVATIEVEADIDIETLGLIEAKKVFA
jgi:hypothetical protein